MNKYLYKIKDLEVPPWLKYWFARKSKVNFDLSQILNGTSFDLTDTVNKKLHLIDIFGNSVQNGEPTPENPIEVNSSGDNGYITEKIVNANLIDFSKFKIINKNTVFTFENDTITISSENGTYNGVVMDITNLVKSNNGKILSFGYEKITEIGEVVKSSQLVITDQKDKNSYYAFEPHNYKYNIPNDTSNIKRVVFQILQNNRPTTNDGTLIIEKPILYFGEVKPTYVEHEEQIYTIPCQQPMRAIGDVKDTFVKIDGVWYERHNIIRKIYDGTERFIRNLTNNGYYVYSETIFNYLRVSGITCESNYFKATANGGYGIMQYAECHLRYSSDDNYKFFYMCTNISTVELFKEWLKEKYDNEMPVYVDYLLEEPLDLPCTQAQITALENLQKARTYKNVTHIYSEDEVPADLEIQYYKEKEEE